MATEWKDLRIRVSVKKHERLKILAKEFGFKSMNKLVNIFIDSGFERIEDKFHFIDKEQGDEIKKIIMQIANDVHDIKINLSRTGSNVNQIARAVNMGVAIGATSRSGSSSSDIFLMKEIEDLEKKIADLKQSNNNTFNEMLIKQYQDSLEKKKAKLQPQIQQNVDVSADVNVSVDEIKNLSKELTEASEKLGKELWKILS